LAVIGQRRGHRVPGAEPASKNAKVAAAWIGTGCLYARVSWMPAVGTGWLVVTVTGSPTHSVDPGSHSVLIVVACAGVSTAADTLTDWVDPSAMALVRATAAGTAAAALCPAPPCVHAVATKTQMSAMIDHRVRMNSPELANAR
jgi:hypothetical protein